MDGTPIDGVFVSSSRGAEGGSGSADSGGATICAVGPQWVLMTPLSPSNVIEHLARGWTAAHVRDTMVGGRFAVREVGARAPAAASRLWERVQGYT